MSKLAQMASTLPFAHLLGLKAAAEDNKPAASAKAEDDDEKKEDAKAKSDKDDEKDEDDEKSKSKSKKAKAKAEGDEKDTDDEDGDDEKKEKAAAFASKVRAEGVAAERARFAGIMSQGLIAHGITGGPIVQALSYGADSDMSIERAAGYLASAEPPRAGASLSERMAAENVTAVRPEAGQADFNSPKAIADMAIAAAAKARGER